VIVDGRLHMLADPVEFVWDRRDARRPWRVRGPGVDLRFVPAYDRLQKLNLGVAGAHARWCVGAYHGAVGPIVVDGLRGWAEDVRLRW
jgi:hypothetical protein